VQKIKDYEKYNSKAEDVFFQKGETCYQSEWHSNKLL
jgi:hypothetical protein